MNNKRSFNKAMIIKKSGILSKNLFRYLIFTLFFIVTSALSLLLIYQLISDKTVFLTLEMFNIEVLVQLFILLIIYFLLDSLRLYYILKALNVMVDFKYIIKLAFINIFVSNITPFATGGGFAQIYFLNKKDVPLGDATAAATIRTAIPIIFFVISTPLILLFQNKIPWEFIDENAYLYIGFIVSLFIFMAFWVYRLISNTKKMKILVYRLVSLSKSKKLINRKKGFRLIKKSFREIDRFSINIRRFLLGNKKYVSISVLLSILFLFSLFMFPVVLIRGMGYQASAIRIITSQILITSLMYFAPTPGATGVAEGGFSLVFSRFVNKNHIVSLTLAWRFFTIYFGMIIGMILTYIEIFNIKKKEDKHNDLRY